MAISLKQFLQSSESVSCKKCFAKKVKSVQVAQFMKAHHNLHFDASLSKKHYLTFFEQERIPKKPLPNNGLPSCISPSQGLVLPKKQIKIWMYVTNIPSPQKKTQGFIKS